MIGSVEAETFVSNGKKIASKIVQIPNVELAAQYKEFLRRLEKVTNGDKRKMVTRKSDKRKIYLRIWRS